MQTYINLFKQNNDHTRIMRQVQFRSSFKKHLRRSSLLTKFILRSYYFKAVFKGFI